MEDMETEVDTTEYVIDIVVRIIYKGENYPDKSYVVKPIEDYIIKKVNVYKHTHRIKRIDIDIDEFNDIEEVEDES